MTSELIGYLFRSDGIDCDMTTEELLVSLLQLPQREPGASQRVLSESVAIQGFLQTFKRMMQVSHPYNEGKSA